MPSRKFEDGDAVMGRWPGSSLYYEVQIISFDPSTQLYSVRYKDGTELEIKESDIRSTAAFRTKKSNSASPSRRRSRSRSPARTRSPGRTPRKPVHQPSPAAVNRNELKREVLKVRLTPLRLDDYKVKKSNGEAEAIGGPVDYVRQPLRTDLEREAYLREKLRTREGREDYIEEVLRAKLGTEEKVVEEFVEREKILRYNARNARKDDFVEKENNNVEVEKPQERPVEKTQTGFLGTIAVLFMMICPPPLLYYLLYQCMEKDASLLSFSPGWALADLWDPTVLGYLTLWLLLQAVLFLLPVGKIAYGAPLAGGRRLTYRMNGVHALFLAAVSVAGLLYYRIGFLYVYQHLLQFVTAAALLSIILGVYAFARSYRAPAEDLTSAASSGSFIYAFFFGRELNPRIGSFDLKNFTQFHTAVHGWVFLNFVMLLAEMETRGLEMPSLSMILVNSFQLLYVLNFFGNMEGILTSLSITHDGFGFQSAYAFLAWIPFVYSLQSLYLVTHPVELSYTSAAAITALNFVGLFLCHRANGVKAAFRKNPDDPKLSYLKTMPTSAGTKLIVSGLWGWVRHPNYLGDIIMAWAWCLPCGFASILPYFYGFLLTGFLLFYHLSRVERECRMKYGPDWDRYCQRVPYRLIPYIY